MFLNFPYLDDLYSQARGGLPSESETNPIFSYLPGAMAVPIEPRESSSRAANPTDPMDPTARDPPDVEPVPRTLPPPRQRVSDLFSLEGKTMDHKLQEELKRTQFYVHHHITTYLCIYIYKQIYQS